MLYIAIKRGAPSETLQNMKPKQQQPRSQHELFQTRLDVICRQKHPLLILAKHIDWAGFDEAFGKHYSDVGRPATPTRIMVGLHYLKHAFNESDESVVERFAENPFWQAFCGLEYFENTPPIDPSSMTRWRNRIGPDGVGWMLQETLEAGKRQGIIGRSEFERVNVDTTVQEKAIAHPTDARLYEKARKKLVKAAKKRGIRIRQSYARKGKLALLKQSRYAHAKQYRRARKSTRELRNYLGRVIRDIENGMPHPDAELQQLLGNCSRIYTQKRNDTNKVYAVHAPEVECISKGVSSPLPLPLESASVPNFIT